MEQANNTGKSGYLTFNYFIGLVAVVFAVFHLYTSTFGLYTAVLQRITHLTFAVVLLSLKQIEGKKGKKSLFGTVSAVAIIVLSLISCVYMFLNYQGFVMRAGAETTLDLVIAGIILVNVIEVTRRATGYILPATALICLIYSLYGSYMPGMFYHKGVPLKRLLAYMSYGTEGILGMPLGVSATYVALFVLFGAFLKESGTGEFFIRLANSLVGGFRGGPAKVAVISSALFGTVSGSAAANVVGTGTFTIPLMMRTGYSSVFAGAVESAASTGGQLMPPVMGAAAFIMAEIVGMPYSSVAIAAIVPSVLFYAAVFMSVDAEALRLGLKGLPRSEIEGTRSVLRSGAVLMLPLMILVASLALGQTVTRSALYSVAACCLIGLLPGQTRMDAKTYLRALRDGGEGLVQVAVVCACAGIIVGTLSLTGLGMKLGYILVTLAEGKLLLLLFLTMLASLVLGMGVPTTACYIIMATVVAPALVRAGVSPLQAHLFVFYFGILSVVTPPVALAAYAAAGISGASPMKTGYAAWRLSLSAFLIPFAFVYGKELLLMGDPIRIALAFISGIASAYALSGFATGYFRGTINLFCRGILLLGAVLLIFPELISDVVGYLIIVVMVLYQRSRARKADVGDNAPPAA